MFKVLLGIFLAVIVAAILRYAFELGKKSRMKRREKVVKDDETLS